MAEQTPCTEADVDDFWRGGEQPRPDLPAGVVIDAASAAELVHVLVDALARAADSRSGSKPYSCTPVACSGCTGAHTQSEATEGGGQ